MNTFAHTQSSTTSTEDWWRAQGMCANTFWGIMSKMPSMAVEIARIALPLIPPSSIHLNEPHATTNNCMPWKCVVFNRLLHVVALYTTMIILLFEATVFSQCFPVNGRQFVETRSLAGRFFTNLQRLKRLITGVCFYSLLWNRFCICVYMYVPPPPFRFRVASITLY